MEQATNEALLRICSNPLYTVIKGIRGWCQHENPPFRYWSPLAKLESRLVTSGKCPHPNNIEVIYPFLVEPWWIPPETHIAPSKEEAIKKHNKIAAEPNQMLIYTDGSDNSHGIGAAAVIPSENIKIGSCLGTKKDVTIYTAELMGICLALEIALNSER